LAGEAKDGGELVEVMVVVKHGEASLCGCGGDQRVGNAYAMCAGRAVCGEVFHGGDCGVCHRAGDRGLW
jgi:hypothetical protein